MCLPQTYGRSFIELIADFNDFDSNSHTKDTLEIYSEKITELLVKMKLSESIYTNEDKVSNKLRSETKDKDIHAVSIRFRHKNGYES